MRKINYILTLLLLFIGANWAKADDQTLALGNYDDLTAYDEDQTYQGSWWMVAPTQYYVKHTGAQIIYTKEQLASMKGKEIKGISFKYYNLSAYQSYPRTINVWVKEIDDNAFVYNEAKKSYCYFDYSDATKAATDFTFDTDFLDACYENGDLAINFNTPFAYSGEKNLLVTITFDGEDATGSSTDIEFYFNTDAPNLAMSTCSGETTFADFNESEDWPYANGGGSTISHATKLSQPLTRFTYQEASKPVVKPAELSGSVKCGESAIAGAKVVLTSGETSLEATSDAEGAYTINIPAEDINKEYTLTATAEGYEDYSTTVPVKFTSDEKKSLNIEMTKKDVPSELSGKVKSNDGNAPVAGAVITLTSGDNKYSATSDENGNYTMTVVKSEETYTLTAKADSYEDKTITDVTFTPGSPKTLDITMIKIDNPATMQGKVTCNDEPVEGAVVRIAAKDNKYVTYSATTTADGSYSIKVVKSEKTYTLTVTDGECEDYTEDNITFTPGETTTKNISLTKTPEPENSVTLGKYNKMLKDGTDEDVYVGHGYSWAAAPTNFTHKYTGSEIIYTKEQLAKMAGKAITKVNFDQPLNYSGDKNLLMALTFEGENTCNVLDLNFFCNPDMKKKAMSYFSDKFTFGDYSETEDWPYLNTDCVSSLEQPVTRFFYTEPTNGINDITTGNTAATKANAATYNLAGQRVGKDYKGIVICNGKKFKK